MAIDRRIVELYDEYTHKPLERRVFLERLARLVGSTAAAVAVLTLLEPDQARAQTIPDNDPRIIVQVVQIDWPGGLLTGTLARPRAGERAPGVLVVHENRGLNAHIRDVTRRLGAAGFLALGLDFLSPLGGTPRDPDEARASIGRLEPGGVLAQGRAALNYLELHEAGNGRVGAVGFCWGGGVVNALAVGAPELDAGVVFYGTSPRVEDVVRIKAPLLLHYAGRDERINAGVPAFEAALKAAGARHTLHMYPDVDHAFHNDTSAERYNPAAAALAFERTVEFLKEQLR